MVIHLNKRYSIFTFVPFLVLTIISSSHARYAMGNPRGEGITRESKTAGAYFFSGLSSIYDSFSVLEEENFYAANRILEQNVIEFFKSALNLYSQIEKRLKGRNINLNSFNKSQISKFKSDLRPFNLDLPKTDKELVRMSIKVIEDFIIFINNKKFTKDANKNVNIIRETNKKIYDVMNLSISLSEIATSIY